MCIVDPNIWYTSCRSTSPESPVGKGPQQRLLYAVIVGTGEMLQKDVQCFMSVCCVTCEHSLTVEWSTSHINQSWSSSEIRPSYIDRTAATTQVCTCSSSSCSSSSSSCCCCCVCCFMLFHIHQMTRVIFHNNFIIMTTL